MLPRSSSDHDAGPLLVLMLGMMRQIEPHGGGDMATHKRDGSPLWRAMLGHTVKSKKLVVVISIMLLAILIICLSVGLAAPKREMQSCSGTLPDGMRPGKEYTMSYPGSGRDWLLFIPANYSSSKPNPVVLSYHGGGRTPERQRDLDLLESPEFNTDYVVVYPRGIEVDRAHVLV
jgi:hypothetical protein